MKTRIFLLLVFLLCSIILHAQNNPLPVEEFQVTSSSGYETTPTLGNDGVTDLVVFTVQQWDPTTKTIYGGSGDIWYQRLVRGSPLGTPVLVSSTTTDDVDNDVWGDHIVYRVHKQIGPLYNTLMMYEISTATSQPISNAPYMLAPHIYKDWVLWWEGDSYYSYKLMVYNLNWVGTDIAPFQIASYEGLPVMQVQISDHFAVWNEYSEGQSDLFARDWSDGLIYRLTNTPLVAEFEASTNGPWVVWTTTGEFNRVTPPNNIMAMNIDTWETRVIADIGEMNCEPNISGDLIVWTSNLNGNYDVFAYKLSTGETFQVTNHPDDQYNNDVFGDLIAYQDFRNGTTDIYVSRFLNPVYIPDPNFEQALIDLGIDSDGTINQRIPRHDAEAVKNLDVRNKNIADLTGIEDFVSLTSLSCNGNQLTSLDMSGNTALTYLLCSNNHISALDVFHNTSLQYLFCSDNNLTSLNVLNNPSLLRLDCGINQIENIDVSNNTALTQLFCHSNKLTQIDATHNTVLTKFNCENNQITSLDLSSNTALTSLNCGKNQLSILDVSSNTALTELECYYNQLSGLDVSQNIALTKLLCFVNIIAELNLSQNISLTWFDCRNNQLVDLDVRNGINTNFTTFNGINNKLTCINVDDETADHSSWILDPGIILSNNCELNTQRGESITTVPIDEMNGTTPVKLTFENVTSSGNTTLEINNTEPEIPEGFAFGNPEMVFNIESTAEYSGIIQIVIDYSGMIFEAETSLRLFHYESGQWVDVTTSVDTENDKIYGEVSNLSQFVVLEDILPPVITNILTPVDPVALGISITVTVTYSDNNLHEAIINWGDGSNIDYGNINEQSQSISWNYIYPSPGVYEVTFKLADMGGNVVESVYEYIVIYDPDGGFVTGGGWINSPEGAYKPDLVLSGKANFGFVAKYKKGSTIPDGTTEFQFKSGNLNFRSSSYEDMRLVIAGAKANFKGQGMVNGTGNYGFMVSAIDGQISGGGGIDKFRIKIWDLNNNDALVYDNNLTDTDENAEPTTSIEGGSIVIHSEQTKSGELEFDISPQAVNPIIKLYPNPFSESLQFEFASPADGNARIDIYDVSGRLVKTIFNNQVNGGVHYKAEFRPNTEMSSIYFYRIKLGEETYYGKALYNK